MLPWSRTGVALLMLALPLSSPAAAATFLPHQAIYELSLQKARGASTLENARGRILYNFTGSSCEGYTSDFRQVSELDGGEGKLTLSDLRSTSWEDGAGKNFRFKIETRMNDGQPAPIEGSASRDGDKVTVTLKQPVAKTFTLDGGVVFPTEHLQRIIEAAQDGKTVLELPVYDGSDTGEKVYNTLSVIGRQVPADRDVSPSDPILASAAMKSLKRWPVTVSYFERGAKSENGEQTPVYAMSFELYENGVSRALKIDYNDFALAGAATKFDVKDSKPCK